MPYDAMEVTDFILGSIEDTDKSVEVADGHHVTAKQKGSLCIQMCDDNENNLSHNSSDRSTLYKVATNLFPLSSHICIRNELFCFAVT